MLRYNSYTSGILLASLLLAVVSCAQEHIQIDTSRHVIISENITDFSSPETKRQPYGAYENAERLNLMNNISSIPEDIITTGKNFFSVQNAALIGIVAGTTSTLYTQDQKLYRVTQNIYTRFEKFRRCTEYGVAFGDGKWQLAGAAVMGFYGYVSNNNRLVKTSFEITEAIVSTGITIQLLKHSIGRESPGSYSRAGGKFHPFPSIHEYSKNQAHYYSFPSGHTATAVTALTVISENYPEVQWIKPASYCAVACLGASLVSKNMHWYSDLPLAAMIGYSFGRTITNRTIAEENESGLKENSVEISLLPALYHRSAGMSLIMSF